MFEVASILITIAAVCSYINYKFIKMPTTIGVMLLTLAGPSV